MIKSWLPAIPWKKCKQKLSSKAIPILSFTSSRLFLPPTFSRYEICLRDCPSMISGYPSLQPRAPIIITNPANKKSTGIKALVDSGAGMTVFHPRIATYLGIDLHTLAARPFSSANHDAVGYDYALQVRLKGDPRHEYLIPCAFLSE